MGVKYHLRIENKRLSALRPAKKYVTFAGFGAFAGIVREGKLGATGTTPFPRHHLRTSVVRPQVARARGARLSLRRQGNPELTRRGTDSKDNRDRVPGSHLCRDAAVHLESSRDKSRGGASKNNFSLETTYLHGDG